MMYLIGSAITLVALTLCISISTMCFRLLRERREKPAFEQGHVAILAGSIALFGVLITGVFFITAFRVDQAVQGVVEDAREVVREAEARVNRMNILTARLAVGIRTLTAQHLEGLESRDTDSLVTPPPPPTESGDRDLLEELYDDTGDVIEEAVEDIGDLGEKLLDGLGL